MSLIFEFLLPRNILMQLVISLIVSPLGFSAQTSFLPTFPFRSPPLLYLSPPQSLMPSYCLEFFRKVPMLIDSIRLKIHWGWDLCLICFPVVSNAWIRERHMGISWKLSFIVSGKGVYHPFSSYKLHYLPIYIVFFSYLKTKFLTCILIRVFPSLVSF